MHIIRLHVYQIASMLEVYPSTSLAFGGTQFLLQDTSFVLTLFISKKYVICLANTDS